MPLDGDSKGDCVANAGFNEVFSLFLLFFCFSFFGFETHGDNYRQEMHGAQSRSGKKFEPWSVKRTKSKCREGADRSDFFYSCGRRV